MRCAGSGIRWVQSFVHRRGRYVGGWGGVVWGLGGCMLCCWHKLRMSCSGSRTRICSALDTPACCGGCDGGGQERAPTCPFSFSAKFCAEAGLLAAHRVKCKVVLCTLQVLCRHGTKLPGTGITDSVFVDFLVC